MWRKNGAKAADYTDVLELDLATVEPSIAGPSRPQDRIPLRNAKSAHAASHKKMADERSKKNAAAKGHASATVAGNKFEVKDGRRTHCRHHQLHQHFQPLCADGGRPAGAQCA